MENGGELRRGVARDMGEMWAGWLTDRPAMLGTCWPKFAWKVIMCKPLDRAEHPPDKCTCNEFDKDLYGARPENEHHQWCPYNPIRELAKL